MKNHNVVVGVFTTFAVVLFGVGLFLIGNQHKAFNRHVVFYTNLRNVNGLTKGAKIRVDGMDAGELQSIEIPSTPSQKFRVKMNVEDRLHGLIREDSLVTVETEGVVGDTFLLIHSGTDHAAEAPAESTLPSKEPLELSKLLEQAQGIMTQASTTINDLQGTMKGHLDTTLDTSTTTIRNVNGLVADVRNGKGAAGMLLEDQATAADIRQSIVNVRQTTDKLNGSVARVDNILADVQNRQVVGKVDQTLTNANSAAKNLDQTTQQINTTLKSAFAEDQYGEDAGANLQQSLTNINQATANLTVRADLQVVAGEPRVDCCAFALYLGWKRRRSLVATGPPEYRPGSWAVQGVLRCTADCRGLCVVRFRIRAVAKVAAQGEPGARLFAGALPSFSEKHRHCRAAGHASRKCRENHL
jgi:phospholipid/cholesterol/gamma-HCH transport system substrate-binding protein